MAELKKIFIEGIYGKNIMISQYMDRLNTLISQNQNEFPEVNMNSVANTVQLSNGLKKQSIFIDGNRIVIDFNEPEDLKKCKELILKVLSMATEVFCIETFNRIGFRTFIGDEEESQDKINDRIHRNFVGLSSSQLSRFGDNIHNFHIGFTSDHGKYKANHNVGMLTTQEVNFNFGKMDAKSRYFLLYDIDFFCDNMMHKGDIGQFLDDGEKQIENQSQEFFKLVGEE